MELDPILTPVEGHADQFAFEADIGFVRDAKALPDDEYAKYSDQLGEGDLLIAGWGANFKLDRENESFMPGSFERGLKTFLSGEATLAYHHKHDIALGRVLSAEQVEGKGVRIVARVDSQPESSPVRHLYEQVKKGTLNALSCGGFFKRKLTPEGWRISDVDLTEWSVTPVPAGRGCNFAVVAGKALADQVKVPDQVNLELPSEDDVRQSDVDELQWALDALDRVFTQIGNRKATVADPNVQ
jgi:HK97 family phage prohead protease